MRPLLLAATLLLAIPAGAVLNDDGNGNTTAPPASDDPGWRNVGTIDNTSAVYLGYGWVITAGHAPNVGTVVLDGANYPVGAGSRVTIEHDETDDADLEVLKLASYPEHLPLLEILPPPTPTIGTKVVVIARGRDRGARSSWGLGGWEWSPSLGSMRWGTNLIGGVVPGAGPLPVAWLDALVGGNLTRTLVTEFTKNAPPASSPHETQVTQGDSGGGLFIETSEGSGVWELAGIAILRTEQTGQPANTAIYNNDSLYADLSYYRAQILDRVRPCADGVDNDGDQLVDYPADLDCNWEGDDSELPQCSDGIDNDFDGNTDYPGDAKCTSANDRFEIPDADGDFVLDDEDNCQTVPNFDQIDTNLDGYGNACDADYGGDFPGGDGVVGTPDFLLLSAAWGTMVGEPGYDPDIDSGSDGFIGTPEFLLLSSYYGQPPGPSGLACAGTIPCQ